MKPNLDQVNKLSEEINKQKTLLKDFVFNMKKTFDEIIEKFEKYMNSFIMIENTFVHKYHSKNWNYQLY